MRLLWAWLQRYIHKQDAPLLPQTSRDTRHTVNTPSHCHNWSCTCTRRCWQEHRCQTPASPGMLHVGRFWHMYMLGRFQYYSVPAGQGSKAGGFVDSLVSWGCCHGEAAARRTESSIQCFHCSQRSEQRGGSRVSTRAGQPPQHDRSAGKTRLHYCWSVVCKLSLSSIGLLAGIWCSEVIATWVESVFHSG